MKLLKSKASLQVLVLPMMLIFFPSAAESQDAPLRDPVSQFVSAWQNAMTTRDAEQLVEIFEKLNFIRKDQKEIMKDQFKEELSTLGDASVKISVQESGVFADKSYTRIQIAIDSIDDNDTACLFIVYDARGIIGGYASLEMYKAERELAKLSPAQQASVHFRSIQDPQAPFHQVCVLDKADTKEAARATQFNGASAMASCRSACPFTMKLVYSADGEEVTVYYGTDGCSQFYFSGWEVQGTTTYSRVLTELIAWYNEINSYE